MSSEDKAVRRAIDHIRGAAGKPYLPQPIPSALDQAVTRVVDAAMRGQDSERRGLASLLTGKPGGVLRVYCERMASLGVRRQARQDLLRGLVALGLAGFWDDPRDDLPLFALHLAAAEKIGVAADKLFAEARGFAVSAEVAAELAAFPARSPEDRSITAMGYSEVTAADGFRYQRDW